MQEEKEMSKPPTRDEVQAEYEANGRFVGCDPDCVQCRMREAYLRALDVVEAAESLNDAPGAQEGKYRVILKSAIRRFREGRD